jgi:ABC-type dipeptide/oligopeptide/nickel transport system permease component
MRFLPYIAKRLLFVIPQLLGIIVVSFALIKAIPGDPAVLMLGPLASQASVDALRAELGLDQPLVVQFWLYLNGLLHGNLGTSWQTTRPVFEDLLLRFPATLELITFGLLGALAIGIPLGIGSAYRRTSLLGRIGDFYGLAAGALPDFWLALVLIYVFYTTLGWAPAPMGRLDVIALPPPQVTGLYTIDSLIAGDWQTLRSAAANLALPVLTLSLINAGPILKMTQATMERMLNADFSRYAELSGLPGRIVVRQAFRNALPSVMTIVSVLYGFLIGGAVLVEIVFSWGGAGQYAVQGVLNSDLNPVMGFVIFAACFSLLFYLLVDLAYFMVDPRVR